MSHLPLVSFFVKLNLPISSQMGIWIYCFGLLLKGREECWWHNWRESFYIFFLLYLCGTIEGQKIFKLQQDRPLLLLPPPVKEILHFWHFDTSLPVRERGATVYCWFLSVKQPSTAFIIPLIALNAAAFLVRLAKLWKLSRGYFVIKFTVMSSGGTGSVKFEITSGHFQRTS